MDAPDLGPRYQPLYRLAAGGMAEVWVGAQKVAAAQRPVAIKRILPQFAEEEKYVRMFLDEAHLAACIDSPNVVALIDADIAEDGAPFLVMELVEGLPLSTMLRSKPPMDAGTVCYVIKEAALGLHDAHEARAATGELLQLVHRDVSPQNLLLGVDGRVRLADFGVAHALERMTLTVGGEFKGKLAYCAPEQLHGKADRRADVFSLGVVIRQALSGQKLFGKSSGNAETLRKLLHEEILPTQTMAPHIDPALAEVIDKALRRDPDARYANAAEFADALTPFVRASRVTLGALVQLVGGAELQQRRDKTTEMFTALKEGASTSFITDPANSLVALSATAETPVPAPETKRKPAKREPKPRIWPAALVMAGAAAVGVAIALYVDGGGDRGETDLGQATDIFPSEVDDPVVDSLDPLVDPLAVDPEQSAPEPTLPDPTNIEGTDPDPAPPEPSAEADPVGTADTPTRRAQTRTRERDATASMDEDSVEEPAATNQTATNQTQMSQTEIQAQEEGAEDDGEDEPTTMGRASRLRRDVF